jgi:prepilin-type N-terminal cleavage/methylation domain-containing protein
MANQRSESGETLLEIIMALVIIGLIFSAYFFTFYNQGIGTTAQRNLVTADAVLRDYAEATKQAVRDKPCTGDPTVVFTVGYTPPALSGINVIATMPASSNPPNLTCPSLNNVNEVDIDATLPNGTTHEQMKIDVRTP